MSDFWPFLLQEWLILLEEEGNKHINGFRIYDFCGKISIPTHTNPWLIFKWDILDHHLSAALKYIKTGQRMHVLPLTTGTDFVYPSWFDHMTKFYCDMEINCIMDNQSLNRTFMRWLALLIYWYSFHNFLVYLRLCSFFSAFMRWLTSLDIAT